MEVWALRMDGREVDLPRNAKTDSIPCMFATPLPTLTNQLTPVSFQPVEK